MVTLVGALWVLLIVGFVLSPLWIEKGRTAYPQELLDRIGHELEDEIRALRTKPDK